MDKQIVEIFKRYREAFNNFQSQRAEILEKLRKTGKTLSISINEIENWKTRANALDGHAKKIKACIECLESDYQEYILSDHPIGRNFVERLHKEGLYNERYEWPVHSTIKAEFLNFLKSLLSYVKRSPINSKTDFFNSEVKKKKALCPATPPPDLTQEMPELSLDDQLDSYNFK